MKFAPVFREEWIGLDPSDNVNKNIEFGVVQSINNFEREGLLKWSSIGGRSMPDGNYLFAHGRTTRIHPAPSYLQNGNYLNCIVIFGENHRQRLLLDGDPTGWQARINEVLIDEQKHYGLNDADRDTLKMIGDSLFWKSGDKILRENSGGLAVLNENADGEKRVSFPVSDRYFSFYNPKNNQLIIHTQYNTWDEEFIIFDREFILE